MAREEKTLTELELQPTTGVDRANDYLWTVDTSDTSMSAYGTSKKVKVEAFIGDPGEKGDPGVDGEDAYVYIAYASDSSGTGFTMTFNPALDYIAIKSTNTEITTPQASDFTGLWKNYKGATGATGPAGADGADGLDINWRGTYSALTSYVVNDAVFYEGSSYICILASTGNLPTNETYWNLMAQAGYSDEQAQDAVGTILTDTAEIDLTYDDITPKITADVKDASIANAKLANMTSKTYKGRTSATTGVPEDVPVATLKSDLSLTKSDVGLGNVDNTSDATKNSAVATLTNKTINADNNTISNLETDNLKTGVLDTDLSSVSALDDTLASAKAIKAYTDSKGYTWKGAWTTSTAYSVNDTVENNGSGYVCKTAHTSGTFATDLSAGKWELFVEGLPDPNITTSTTTNLTGVITGNGSVLASKTNPSGAFVGTTDTQTLTNKTLTSPVLNMGDSMPSTNVRCSARRANNQNITANTVTTVIFDSETYDTGSDYNPSTGLFTAPVSGYYQVNITVFFSVASDLDFLTVWIGIGGSASNYYSYFIANGANTQSVSVSATVYCASGSTISAMARNQNNNDSIGANSFMTIHLLSV